MLRFPSIQDPVPAMVRRRMALLTYRGKVCRAVGPVLHPVSHMVYMEDGTVLNGPPADPAGVVIPEEDGST